MLNLEDLITFGACRTSTAATANTTLSASGLLKQLERVCRQIEWGAPRAPRGQMQVRESPLALQTVPVKRHKKRRDQTEAYHRRVQKKWTKRYGTKQVPTAYVVDNGVIGGYGQTLIAHPSIVARLKTPNV